MRRVSLLAARFKLVAHRGSKEFPIYALVLARPDGSLGPRLDNQLAPEPVLVVDKIELPTEN